MKDSLKKNLGEIRFLRGSSYTFLLLGLVLVFSFALGYLYNEIKYIEKLLGL